jgi:hypothetical protein
MHHLRTINDFKMQKNTKEKLIIKENECIKYYLLLFFIIFFFVYLIFILFFYSLFTLFI